MKAHSKRNKKGQVLLIVIMLLATVITVITTVSFRSRTETQVSKLNEDSQKTLAAAEAGIEKAIAARIASGNDQSFSGLNLNNLSGIDLGGSKVSVKSNITNEFVSPLVQKDQQYTFYMANYDSSLATPFSGSYSNNISVYYGSETPCSRVALEITVVSRYSAPHTMTRFISDSTGVVTSPAGNPIDNVVDSSYTAGSRNILNTTFNCKTNIVPKSADTIVLIIRSIGDRTKIGVVGSQANPSLSPQGKFIVSEAKSQTGVVKKVQLFQSLPQIPAEFFVSTL